MWILGIVICSFGVAILSIASFGLGVIQGPSYAIYLKLSDTFPGFTFGISSYLMEALFLLLLCIILKKFRWKYLLSFGTAFLFGLALDAWRLAVGTSVPESLLLRVLLLIGGILSTSFAVACYFRTDMPLEVWELFIKEISDRFNLDTAKFKWIFDILMLVAGIILCFIFFGSFRFDIIGIGTIASAAFGGPLIAFWGKILDRAA